ncbi:hypothetical protein PF002_g32712, partial [Phytophthora fragariae]
YPTCAFVCGNTPTRTASCCFASTYPKRLYDMIKVFGRSTGQISRLFRHMVLYIYDRYKDLIYFQHRICSERIHIVSPIVATWDQGELAATGILWS